MRKHWKEGASPILRAQLEALESQPWRMADGRLSEAQADMQLQNLAWANGLNTSAPRMGAVEKIAELRAAKDFRELNRLYLLSGLDREAEQQQSNQIRWAAMQQKWALEPSAEERQAESLAAAAAAAREAEIEARALAIVAEQNRAALDKARAQARKELANAR